MPRIEADELPHDLGPLRIAEVHVVGDGDRVGADGRQVAPGLDHGLLGAHLGIGGDVARGDVAGDREALLRAVDAHDAGVAAGAPTVSPMTM